jgi:hypothetical protein
VIENMSNFNVGADSLSSLDNSGLKVAFEVAEKQLREGERRGTSFRVNTILHRLLKACAALQDRQEGDLVNEAIADLLVKYNYLDIREKDE